MSRKAEILQTLVELGVPVNTNTKLAKKLMEEYLPDEDMYEVKQISIVL